MAVVVVPETGAGVPAANSYDTVVAWKAWADSRLHDYSSKSDDEIGAAMIRTSEWIDFTYRRFWPGIQTYGPSGQGLLWPRRSGTYVNGVFSFVSYLEGVVNSEGVEIAVNSIPRSLKLALYEGTWRELNSPGILAPDLDRGGAIKSISAGSVSVEYFGSAAAMTTFTVIDGLLADLFGVQESSGYTARAVRA